MKKLSMILLALLIVAAGVLFTVSAEPVSEQASEQATEAVQETPSGKKTYISPTAPTIPTAPTVTQTNPTVPGVISTTGSTPTTGYPGTTGPSVVTTKAPSATTARPASTGTTAKPTTPDGSTVTGTVKPDQNPESPKTGDTGAEVFAFAALVLACSGAAVVLKKRKNDR